MYKYSFKGQVHSARDLYEARHKAGLAMPIATPTVSPSVVRLWQWDEEARDYAVEIFNTPGHQIFNSYDEARVCYNTLAEFFPDEITEDLKLELVNFHRGETYQLASKILLPPVHAWQW